MRLNALRAVLTALAFVTACAPVMRSTISGVPTPAQMAELWKAPDDGETRDLIYGPNGRRRAPDPKALYTFVKEERIGFSWKMEVEDPSGARWDVKLGPEAQPEVAASRILWALGYHQPPNYYLPVWTMADKSGKRRDMPPARFLADNPGMKRTGAWSWYQNPFVDTQPFRGLIVLMMVLNSSDLKAENNAVYELPAEREGARRWYVVKDLGATLGDTGRQAPVRGDAEAFERHGFIRRVSDGYVRFEFKGRHQEILRAVRPRDVEWACNLLKQMDAAEWRDAFRAGGFSDERADRFIRKIQEKVAQGLSLVERGER